MFITNNIKFFSVNVFVCVRRGWGTNPGGHEKERIMDKSFQGSKVKYLVNFQSDGFDMDRDDFNITLRRGNVSRTFPKSELVREETAQGINYYLCFDNTEFGPGQLTMIVEAYVPDTDFPDGYRTELDKFILTQIEAV